MMVCGVNSGRHLHGVMAIGGGGKGRWRRRDQIIHIWGHVIQVEKPKCW